eukprot:2151435-Alexandrium_andersonii.AAC.1
MCAIASTFLNHCVSCYPVRVKSLRKVYGSRGVAIGRHSQPGECEVVQPQLLARAAQRAKTTQGRRG